MRLEDCPARITADVIGGKWKPVILYHLMTGTKRFGELRRLLPDATQKMLTQQLRELADDGIVSRRAHPGVPLKVEYSLTVEGESLRPVMHALCQWGESRRASQAASLGMTNGRARPPRPSRQIA